MWTIVVAGGTGQRFGNPKQYELLDDRRVIDHSRSIAEIASAGVVVVVPASDAEREGGVAGGSTRSESVRAGLAAVPPGETVWAQVSPGNAQSLRAFLACGFVPIGSEVLIRPGA